MTLLLRSFAAAVLWCALFRSPGASAEPPSKDLEHVLIGSRWSVSTELGQRAWGDLLFREGHEFMTMNGPQGAWKATGDRTVELGAAYVLQFAPALESFVVSRKDGVKVASGTRKIVTDASPSAPSTATGGSDGRPAPAGSPAEPRSNPLKPAVVRAPEFTALLDSDHAGKWKLCGSLPIKLQNGVVDTTSPKAEGWSLLWYTAKKFGDFTLKCEFERTDRRAGKSGILLRFDDPGSDPQNAENTGYEINLNGPEDTGGVDRFQHPRTVREKPGEWNELEITMVGSHLAVSINKQLVNEYDAGAAPTGYIGLQNREGGPGVQFRNVSIKEWPSQPSSSPKPQSFIEALLCNAWKSRISDDSFPACTVYFLPDHQVKWARTVHVPWTWSQTGPLEVTMKIETGNSLKMPLRFTDSTFSRLEGPAIGGGNQQWTFERTAALMPPFRVLPRLFKTAPDFHSSLEKTDGASGAAGTGPTIPGPDGTRFTMISLAEIANHPLDHLTKKPAGRVTFLGVPFDFENPPREFLSQGPFSREQPPNAVLQVNVSQPMAVHVLLAGSGVPKDHELRGRETGSIKLRFGDGTELVVPLKVGVNLRESWRFNDEDSPAPATEGSVRMENVLSENQNRGRPATGVIDMLVVDLPITKTQTSLASIVFSDTSQESLHDIAPGIAVFAVTVWHGSPAH